MNWNLQSGAWVSVGKWTFVFPFFLLPITVKINSKYYRERWSISCSAPLGLILGGGSCDVVLFHAQRLFFFKSLIVGNLEQRIMPEAFCDIRKSGVERNVIGRFLTLTYIYVSFLCLEILITGYLRGEVRLPGNLFLSARPKVSITCNTGF